MPLGWLKRFYWLSYTAKGDPGEFSEKRDHQKLNALVAKHFNKWKDAIEAFVQHSQTAYHKNNFILTDNFITTFNRSAPDITMQLNSSCSKQIAENRRNLAPINETIILCGRHELALRGTSDFGPAHP